jgi:hypothetical protein
LRTSFRDRHRPLLGRLLPVARFSALDAMSILDLLDQLETHLPFEGHGLLGRSNRELDKNNYKRSAFLYAERHDASTVHAVSIIADTGYRTLCITRTMSVCRTSRQSPPATVFLDVANQRCCAPLVQEFVPQRRTRRGSTTTTIPPQQLSTSQSASCEAASSNFYYSEEQHLWPTAAP